MDIMWKKLEPSIPKDKHNISQILFRAGIILIMGGVAAAVPRLEPFIGLVGAVFFSVLGKFTLLTFFFRKSTIMINFFFLFFYFQCKGLLVPAVVETVFLYPDHLGFGNWILWKNIFLTLFAILALITGTFTSVLEIIHLYTT